jgi:hypothetical protein
MVREKYPQKRITQQKKRLEELKAQIWDNKVYV